MDNKKPIKAVGLLSGGLDSTLAAQIMVEQGVKVTALHFRTGFSFIERKRMTRRGLAEPSDIERAVAMLGVSLEVIDISDEYLPLVLHPRYGYGSGMNPCVDCRIFLLRQAKAWMETHDYHFVFTGEVVGQRPKSQMRPTLKTVERESGLQGYLLRPLSAKLLKPTVPEQEGWVDRERMYAISGRGRKEQIHLAERFGITDYPQPSGGCCYLIDQTYSRRLRNFLAHEGSEVLTTSVVQLLAVGRHLRLSSGRKVIVGRHERENEHLATRGAEGVLLTTVDHPGPTTLIPGRPVREEIELAARITAGYSDGRQEPAVRVEVHYNGGQGAGGRVQEAKYEVLTVKPMARGEIQSLMV
ncbi:MAG: 7-cyano-7-deazaguanine synthase [Chloroflexota bacterium]|nr:7-cyano-7-deazaguanine synthase [Chloroflexota bacterium]